MAYNDSGRAPADEFPPAAGVRLPWSAIPLSLRAAVEATLGEPVVEAVTQSGGFSPGVAARLRGAGGRRAFVKALGPEPNPESRAYHRVEAHVTAALPADAPVPRLLDWYDRDEWVVLLFEDVDGVTPTLPWRPDELARVLAAVGDLAAALTPTPVAAPPVAERFDFRGWRRLAADPDPRVDPWAGRHLDRLAELESRWVAAAAGDTLVHADLRADNLLLTPDRVVVVDWPWACVGAPWFDLLAMLPSVAMQGGPRPHEVFDDHPVAAGADPAAVTAVVAALAGFFGYESLQPAPPGLPTLRDFQAAQARTALDWLRTRVLWSPRS